MIPSSACQPWPPDQPGQAGIVVALGSYTTIRDTTVFPVQTEPEAHCMDHPSHVQLRRCVLGANTGHLSATRFRREMVSH